ncbi:AP-3 complex subunit sigma-1 [Pitangus sulphuratus]|nr:AP-3 complex subunit sigma-1 [Pitangus sulphuratus]
MKDFGKSEDTQQQIIRETFHLVSKRDENVCNFLEGGLLIGGSDNKLIYRHYATLYFVFCVDSSESELGILDLIQVFVETLDKCFENVCELDLIFHVDKVHNILAEMVMGGMVLETNMNEIVTQIDAQNKLEKSEHMIVKDNLAVKKRGPNVPLHEDTVIERASEVMDLINLMMTGETKEKETLKILFCTFLV